VDGTTGPAWSEPRNLLGEISRSRALQGFTSTETATFVFSLKEPLLTLLRDEIRSNAQQLADLTWTVTKLLDALGLYTIEVYAQSHNVLGLMAPLVNTPLLQSDKGRDGR
jgi:rsbT co-antagonist protein RsbR